MKNKKRIFVALGLTACVALGAVSFTACDGTAGENGKSAYEIAVENGFAGTEAEWLESLKGTGKDGKDGKDGKNGTDGKDGEDGKAGKDGEDGKAGKDGEDGKDGKDGENGKDGNTWLVGTTAPAAEEGNDGDLYLDYSTWNVYHKVNGEWVLLGNIKGEDGVGGGEEQPEPDVPSGTQISVDRNGTYDMPISGISEGVHIIEADLGEIKLSMGRLYAQIGNGGLSELFYSESRSTEGHNVYYGFIQIAEGDSAITFSTAGEAVEATVVMKDWGMPTLTADTPVEMPVNIYQTADENLIKIKLDSSMAAGTYKIYIDGNSSIIGAVKFFVGTKLATITTTSYNGGKTIDIDEDLLSNGEIYCYLIVATSSASKQISPVTLTLTKAS